MKCAFQKKKGGPRQGECRLPFWVDLIFKSAFQKKGSSESSVVMSMQSTSLPVLLDAAVAFPDAAEALSWPDLLPAIADVIFAPADVVLGLEVG